MNHLWRLNLCAVIALTMALPNLAASWIGGRGPGNRAAFPDIPFPQAPAVVWKAYLGKDFVNVPPSNALIAGDTLIVAYGSYLLGVATDSGDLRWEQELPEVPIGHLLLLDNQVITFYSPGDIIAFNPSDGKIAWKQRLPNGLRNDPVFTDSYFIFTTQSNTLDVIARKTGAHLRTIDAQDKIEASAVFFGHSLVLAYDDGIVKRLDDHLVTRWTLPIPEATISQSPVTDGKTIFVTYANSLIALNPMDSTTPVRWLYNCPDRLLDSPVTLDGDRVYFVTESGRLYALDAATGKDLWSSTEKVTKDDKTVTETKSGKSLYANPVGEPVVFGDSLLVRMQSGLMALYDKQTGQTKWLYRLKPPEGVNVPATTTALGMLGNPGLQALLNPSASTITPGGQAAANAGGLPAISNGGVPATAYMGAPAIDGSEVYFAGMDGFIYHLSANAPDIDTPTFDLVYPTIAERASGYLTADKVQYLGATVQDEGSGIEPAKVSIALDGKDLTKSMEFDAASCFYYYKIPATSPLSIGMHRLTMTALDARGLLGTLNKDFVVAPEKAKDRVVINIGGEFVPKHLIVQPGYGD